MYQIMDSIMNETEGSGRWDVSTVFIRPDGSYLIRRLDIVCGDALYHVPNEGKYQSIRKLSGTSPSILRRLRK